MTDHRTVYPRKSPSRNAFIATSTTAGPEDLVEDVTMVGDDGDELEATDHLVLPAK
jgi:hypothetical protein